MNKKICIKTEKNELKKNQNKPVKEGEEGSRKTNEKN